MWPEFDEGDLDAALEEFKGRQRRFGGVPASMVQSGAA
jgi:undecaprenyl diphosphate synthase